MSHAARFLIDVEGVDGRSLKQSVQQLADAQRCPSTPIPLSFSRMNRKDHTSTASWPALSVLAFDSRNKAGLGVNGFVNFSQKKSRSAAGPKTGTTR